MGKESRLNPTSTLGTPASTRDARGRLLQEGDEVLLHIPGPIYFRVARVAPSLDPKAPPNAIHLTLTARADFVAIRDQANLEFIRVRSAEEITNAETTTSPAAGGPHAD